MTQTFYKEQTDTIEAVVEQKNLVLHNDEVNTFEWVIDSIMDICQHTEEQAEQLTILVHFKGKATVKQGQVKELFHLKQGFTDRGINATIE